MHSNAITPSLHFPTPTPLGDEETQPPTAPSSVIVLDPGNDPKHPGAGAALTLYEEDFTLLICEKLKTALEETQNFTVELTRTRPDTGTVTNMQRTGFANAQQAAVFISVQCGGLYSRTVSRAGVFFMNQYLDHPTATKSGRREDIRLWNTAYAAHQAESIQLASVVVNELKAFYEINNIVQIDENPRPGRLAVLRGLTMPGIVIELGNLNHPQTARFLFQETTMNDLVQELNQAISNFLYSRSGIQKIGQR